MKDDPCGDYKEINNNLPLFNPGGSVMKGVDKC